MCLHFSFLLVRAQVLGKKGSRSTHLLKPLFIASNKGALGWDHEKDAVLRLLIAKQFRNNKKKLKQVLLSLQDAYHCTVSHIKFSPLL